MQKSNSADNQQESRSLTIQEAYLLGVHLTDGCTNQRKAGKRGTRDNAYLVQLMVLDRDFVERWAKCAESMGYRPSIRPMRVGNRSYWIGRVWRKALFNFLNESTANKEQFPPAIWDASSDVQWGFVCGMMDSDGWSAMGKRPNGRYAYQVGFANTCRWMVEDLRRLLQSLGVKVGGIHEQNLRNNAAAKRRYWRILINIQSLIDAGFEFGIARKNDRLILYKLGLFELVSPETIRQTLVNAKEDMVRSGRRLSELGRNDLAAYLPNK